MSSLSHVVDEGHARVLRALHEEILAYGLVSAQELPIASTKDSYCCCSRDDDKKPCCGLVQGATGAFPPLRYLDGEGRVIVIRALAMFDDLIVNATATTAAGGHGGGGAATAVSRRVTFDVSRWLDLDVADDGSQQQQLSASEVRELLL